MYFYPGNAFLWPVQYTHGYLLMNSYRMDSKVIIGSWSACSYIDMFDRLMQPSIISSLRSHDRVVQFQVTIKEIVIITM